MKNFDDIKVQMLKVEYSLSPVACKSNESIRLKDEEDDIRLHFERDVDRIIHTLSYTRYLDKTQVYSKSGNDNISKRMTHVQFVSRSARTIARALGLNEDLCEAISLGHDIGHTPFGHTGEAILNDISKKYMGRNFAHNLNSVRMLMNIEKFGKGCNLSLQVLDGIMCHNGEMVKAKYKPVKKDINKFLSEYENCNLDDSNIKKLVPMTLEGCVVRISDIIGYLGKDLDDARRLGLFDEKILPKEIKETLGTTNDEIMNTIILDIIEQSFGKEYIQMSDKVYDAVVSLKKFNYANIYYKANTQKDLEEYKKIFNLLFEIYLSAVQNNDKSNDIYTVFLNDMCEEYIVENSNEQKVIDFLASMTDNYIKRQYKKYVECEEEI